ncbi:MAG TPA: RNase adapter RapZ [Acidimicrobiales bacterium]|nr:RNase adapter RapZ [Acidimicrobiales bacterium]
MNEFLVIAGLSGAGRSTAAAALEDLGWEVIDNLPPRLIPELTGSAERLALVVGRSLDQAEVQGIELALQQLRSSGATVQVLFLDAADDVLVRRYEGTRRRHPVQGEEGVVGSIASERELLASIKAQADVVVDTTELNVHQLRERLVRTFGRDDPTGNMRTAVVSFGYTHGIPLDVDLVFDCRFLPNPYWDDELRPFTGRDEQVKEFVLGQPETAAFLDKLDDLFGLLLPAYVKEGKSYLTIAVGCTGGRHRSVVLAQELADRLAAQGFSPTVHHRDIER